MSEGEEVAQLDGGQPAAEYSRAFGNLVNNPDDVVGLLAYALFKQVVAENIGRGIKSVTNRDLGASECAMYRSSAEQMLGRFAEDAVNQARDGIADDAVTQRMNDISSEIDSSFLAIINHVDKRTSLGPSLIANLIGWLLSIAATVLVLLGIAVTGWGDYFIDKLQNAVRHPPAQSSAEVPSRP